MNCDETKGPTHGDGSQVENPSTSDGSQTQTGSIVVNPTDRHLLANLADAGAPPPSALTGTDIASFALSPGSGKLSRGDLNRIGLQLMKEAASGKNPDADYRSASTIFSTLASVNKPSPVSAKPPPRNVTPHLARAMKMRTVDVTTKDEE